MRKTLLYAILTAFAAIPAVALSMEGCGMNLGARIGCWAVGEKPHPVVHYEWYNDSRWNAYGRNGSVSGLAALNTLVEVVPSSTIKIFCGNVYALNSYSKHVFFNQNGEFNNQSVNVVKDTEEQTVQVSSDCNYIKITTLMALKKSFYIYDETNGIYLAKGEWDVDA